MLTPPSRCAFKRCNDLFDGDMLSYTLPAALCRDVADSIAEEGGGTDAAGGEEGEDTAAATAADSGGALPASGSADGAANKDGAANGDVDGEGEDLDEEAAMLVSSYL